MQCQTTPFHIPELILTISPCSDCPVFQHHSNVSLPLLPPQVLLAVAGHFVQLSLMAVHIHFAVNALMSGSMAQTPANHILMEATDRNKCCHHVMPCNWDRPWLVEAMCTKTIPTLSQSTNNNTTQPVPAPPC